MTVGLGALCDNGTSCVVAADREMTVMALSLEYEHGDSKIEPLSPTCVIISAGDALLAAEILGSIDQARLASDSIRAAAEAVRDAYVAAHLSRAESVVLRPRGLTWEDFRHRAHEIPLQSYLGIDQLLFNFGIGAAEFLVAGTDPSGAHLFRVHYNGVAGGSWLEWCTKLGYRTIGSGSPHASVFLALEQQHRRLSTAETLFNVYCAKKSAELAPGVGKATDLAIIHRGRIEQVPEGLLADYERLRQENQTNHVEAARLRELYEQRAVAYQSGSTYRRGPG